MQPRVVREWSLRKLYDLCWDHAQQPWRRAAVIQSCSHSGSKPPFVQPGIAGWTPAWTPGRDAVPLWGSPVVSLWGRPCVRGPPVGLTGGPSLGSTLRVWSPTGWQFAGRQPSRSKSWSCRSSCSGPGCRAPTTAKDTRIGRQATHAASIDILSAHRHFAEGTLLYWSAHLVPRASTSCGRLRWRRTCPSRAWIGSWSRAAGTCKKAWPFWRRFSSWRSSPALV